MALEWNWQDDPRLNLPIRSQGKCGCCWAIVDADLTTFYLRLRYPFDFLHHPENAASSQELLDKVIKMYPEKVRLNEQGGCDKNNCYGCKSVDGFRYIIEHGVTTDSCYPFRARRHIRLEPPKVPKIRLQNVVELDLTCKTERDIQEIIRTQPIAGTMDLYASFWKLGKHEMYMRNEGKYLGAHEVIIMGYGYHKGNMFYHIRNSWSKKWGNDGYGKVYSDLITPSCYATDASYECA